MSAWSGFTDEDEHQVSPSVSEKPEAKHRLLSEPRQKSASVTRHTGSRIRTIKSNESGQQPWWKEQDPSQQNALLLSPPNKSLDEEKAIGEDSNTSKNMINLDEGVSNVNDVSGALVNATLDGKENDSVQHTDNRQETGSLEKFRERQKLMEAANAKRKAMLKEAINSRKRKTMAEQNKLSHIQKELEVIDSLVTSDVCLLRDKIEESSRDFLDAQKRYEKAEREFIAAKLHLHESTERKEQLTEHLCTIISENENRKAKKLSELMASLNMDDTTELIITPTADSNAVEYKNNDTSLKVNDQSVEGMNSIPPMKEPPPEAV